MRQSWPQIRPVHQFGSILDEQFRSHSELDLLVDGLPPESLISSTGIAEEVGPLPVELKRRKISARTRFNGYCAKDTGTNTMI